MNILAKIGLITPPCRVPEFLSIILPSDITIGTFKNLSMYRIIHFSLTCRFTEHNNFSWSILSKSPTISNSITHGIVKQFSLALFIASNADLFGLYP